LLCWWRVIRHVITHGMDVGPLRSAPSMLTEARLKTAGTFLIIVPASAGLLLVTP
jgi:hypothetical protein